MLKCKIILIIFFNITLGNMLIAQNHLQDADIQNSIVSSSNLTDSTMLDTMNNVLVDTYQLPLRYPYTWLSIPRHARTTGPNLTPTPDVFAQDNIEGGYNYLKLDYNDVIPGPPFTDNIVSAIWINNPPTWTYLDDIMEDIHSARGYKLELQQESPPMMALQLTLEGDVQDPYTEFELYCNENNWIGYYLYEPQSVFNALGAFEPYIYHIMHQDYTCYRYNFPVSNECNTKSTDDYPPGTWICNGTPNIKFGDMIIVKPTTDFSNFNWNPSSNVSSYARPEVEYYVFEEKAAYSTFVIELDTAQENPQEIAAFVNDTCVGASSVITTDSVVVLMAYLGDQPGDSVVFEQHFTNKATANHRISNYLVLNPDNGIRERRVVKTGERKDVHIVSFAKAENITPGNQYKLDLNIYPNPAGNMVTIEYSVEQDGKTTIEVVDKLGRKVNTVLSIQQNKGTHSLHWDIRDGKGNKLVPGIYLVKLTTGNQMVSKKLIIN